MSEKQRKARRVANQYMIDRANDKKTGSIYRYRYIAQKPAARFGNLSGLTL